MKVQSVIVRKVITVRIILCLTINLSVLLPVECRMLEVAFLVTGLMSFILFLVRIAKTSMLVQLLILRLDLEFTKVHQD